MSCSTLCVGGWECGDAITKGRRNGEEAQGQESRVERKLDGLGTVSLFSQPSNYQFYPTILNFCKKSITKI